MERMAFQKPKQAFLALTGGQIVGMASYRIFTAKNNQTIGYVKTGFVVKGFEGKGIGIGPYRKATLYLT